MAGAPYSSHRIPSRPVYLEMFGRNGRPRHTWDDQQEPPMIRKHYAQRYCNGDAPGTEPLFLIDALFVRGSYSGVSKKRISAAYWEMDVTAAPLENNDEIQPRLKSCNFGKYREKRFCGVRYLITITTTIRT